MAKQVVVIGGGWFGCHIAKSLQDEYTVSLLEKSPEIFTGTSGHNQNRLHLGFHYPRSHQTRMCAKQGYTEFIQEYGDLCEDVKNNIYGIAAQESFMDFETYLSILDCSGLEYEIVNPKDYGLTNVTGAVKCKEKLIRNDKAKKYFEDLFWHDCSSILSTNTEVAMDNINDSVIYINCTSQMFMHNKEWNLHYEPCVMFNYKCNFNHSAITIMDGELCTIYPKGDNIFTLYSVNHSPIGEADHPSVARMISKQFDVDEKRKLFEDQISNYQPYFTDYFEYCGHETSMRVSVRDNSDKRVPEVSRIDNVIHVLPSKIDNIFHAEREVKKLL